MPKLYRDAETVPAHHETPDVAELRRIYEEAMRVGSNEMAWDEWTTAISEAAEDLFDAASERDALRAELAHMTEARDNARAEAERLTAKLDAIEADDKLSIMFGWLVYDVGEHTCGGYGPESGYAHEPNCGFEPVLRLDKLEGWPGEKPQP